MGFESTEASNGLVLKHLDAFQPLEQSQTFHVTKIRKKKYLLIRATLYHHKMLLRTQTNLKQANQHRIRKLPLINRIKTDTK